MIRRTALATAVAAAAIAAAAFAPAASARTAWSVTIGAPGFVVSAGEPFAGAPAYRPYWHGHHRYYAPPVVYTAPYPAPYYAPPVVYTAPYPAPYYAPPRVVYRPAYVAPPVVYRPYDPY